MSSQKGNDYRTRSQKYKNKKSFKNNLYDTSHMTKAINNIQVCNVCLRCKQIIEWKIKYKKYKPLKAPAKCIKCEEKTVKHAYHTICSPCAKTASVCPKCGSKKELVESIPNKAEQLKLDAEMQVMLKKLPERKRRTFLRFLNKVKGEDKRKKRDKPNEFEEIRIPEILRDIENCSGPDREAEENKLWEEYHEGLKEVHEFKEITRDDLMAKLKSLSVGLNDSDSESDQCDSEDDDYFSENSSSESNP